MDEISPERIFHANSACQNEPGQSKADKDTDELIVKLEQIFERKVKHVKSKHSGEHMYDEVRNKERVRLIDIIWECRLVKNV